ncbi:hypothetical protein CGCF415_v000509 [Colletotrichum fructicola]|uniref:Uncharacterized protein n=1 Tax=Colletotrichum fructicola (strain Nara gc5) TaxID=1213859 RepID=A0A7J6J9V7_COLFN|nr:hypothetical protein CFRS1_v006658 [Colletotrichum fructicola]KAF4486070.1 hypothetical protein CGGC5_v005437 [Colletotrichum fructicola Nara gc5]KAF4885464.1 hypothetical protein CGCFRS4_v011924 [Colletotrichum fructicola]KAF4916610.1 hypothetical protein CGCF415_v000509 [Colletotrichum fructicola]KAF4940412.1 hypothetical protein CGCF245_v002671 [Colletotrichum fructicola]
MQGSTSASEAVFNICALGAADRPALHTFDRLGPHVAISPRRRYSLEPSGSACVQTRPFITWPCNAAVWLSGI